MLRGNARGAEAKLEHVAERQQQLLEELQATQGKLREAEKTSQQAFVQQMGVEQSSYHHAHGGIPS